MSSLKWEKVCFYFMHTHTQIGRCLLLLAWGEKREIETDRDRDRDTDKEMFLLSVQEFQLMSFLFSLNLQQLKDEILSEYKQIR